MSRRERRYGLVGRLALTVTGLLLAAVAMELALRILLPRYLNPFQPDEAIGYRLKANFDGRYPWTPVRTDREGHRSSRKGARRHGPSIVFVGDSVTFGFGVGGGKAYPFRFGKRIGRRGHVVNAAVPGYNLEQVLGTIHEVLAHERPRLIVYGLCLNDIGSALVPTSYESIDPHKARSKEGGLLSSSLLVSVGQRRLQKLAWRIAPPPAPETMYVLLRDLDESRLGPSLRAFDRQWGELEDIQRRTAIPIVVVVLPYRQQVLEHPDWRAPQAYVAKKCASSPLRCLDPLDVFLHAHKRRLFNGASSMHLSPRGHRVLARWLAAEVRDLLAAPQPQPPGIAPELREAQTPVGRRMSQAAVATSALER